MSLYNVLFILLVFSFLLSAVAMWVNWYLNQHELAVRTWAVALTIMLFGCGFSVVSRVHLPTTEAMIPLNFYSLLRDFATSLNGLAWMTLWAGTLRFMGRKGPRKRSLFVAWLGFFALLSLAHPLGIAGAWNVAWISALVALCSLMILYEILRPGMGGMATWFACAGFSLAAVTWGVRATMSFIDLGREIDSSFDTAVLFGAVVSAYACMLGMVLLTNQRLIDQLSDLENRDPLTSVLNRRTFLKSVGTLITQVENNNQDCSLILLNVDNFKDINNEYGYESGDNALRQLSIISMQVLGRKDLFARCDGDEFVFFLFGKKAVQARLTMNRLQILLQQNLVDSQKGVFQIHASMGISEWQFGEDLEQMISRANKALAHAKSKGSNQIIISEANKLLEKMDLNAG